MSLNKSLNIIITSLVGTVLTYLISITLGLGAIIASGLVGILASLLLPTDLSIVAYTGAFAGMSSNTVLQSYPMVIVAGLLVGGVFILTQSIYQGFGGKLGTISACSVIITVNIFAMM